MQVDGFMFITAQSAVKTFFIMLQTVSLVLTVHPVKRVTTLHLIKMIMMVTLVLKQLRFQLTHGATESIDTALIITQPTIILIGPLDTLAVQNLLNQEIFGPITLTYSAEKNYPILIHHIRGRHSSYLPP